MTNRLSTAVKGGAVVSAFLASLCCLGPLVFALIGVGGAGLLVKFEPFRPYLSLLTVALLGAGFYWTYHQPKAVEGDACDCPHPRSNKAGKLALWLVTIAVVGFLAFPYLAPYLFG